MSENIYNLIDLIAQGRNVEATDVLNSELMARAYERIDEIRPEVASSYFSPILDSDEE